jgi:hypothetical protein
MYRAKKWIRAEFVGRMNCLRRQYNMRRISYNRWHRIGHVYHNRIWRHGDLLRAKKINHKRYHAVVRGVKALYAREYRRHLRILRVLSTNCFKRLKKLVKLWRRKRIPRKKFVKKVRKNTRRYKWRKSWTTTTSTRTLWRGIKWGKTVLDKKLSSVEEYAKTIELNKTKFTQADQKLIAKCAKFFLKN